MDTITANVKRGEALRATVDRRTIYVRVGDREMWQRAEQLAGDSLAGLVADLLRNWVNEQEAKARMRETGMERVEVIDGGRRKAFKGRQLALGGTFVIYLTEQGRLAVQDVAQTELLVYDTFPDLENDEERFGPELLQQVANLIGEEYVEELDI